jgi:hypothetical protein
MLGLHNTISVRMYKNNDRDKSNMFKLYIPYLDNIIERLGNRIKYVDKVHEFSSGEFCCMIYLNDLYPIDLD